MTAPLPKVREILETLPPSYPKWAVVCVPSGGLVNILDAAEELSRYCGHKASCHAYATELADDCTCGFAAAHAAWQEILGES